MDTTITTTEDLERRISGIIHTYRQEAYAIIEEKMWAALTEAATCILQNEGLFLLSRRAINGVSTSTLNNACMIIESEGKFNELAKMFGRNPGAIERRIEKLELVAKYGGQPQPTL